MSCRRCRYEHGITDGLCGDCSRWGRFTRNELDALAGALSVLPWRRRQARRMVELLGLRLQIVAARRDVSETAG